MDWNRVLKTMFWTPISWKESIEVMDICVSCTSTIQLIGWWRGISNDRVQEWVGLTRTLCGNYFVFRISVTLIHKLASKMIEAAVSNVSQPHFETLGDFSDVFNDVSPGPEYSAELPLTEMQHKLARLAIKNMTGQFIVRVVAMGEEDMELFHITPTAKHSSKVFTIQWSEAVQKIVETME